MATWRHPNEGFPDWQQQLEPLRRLLKRWGRGRTVWLALVVVLLLWLASGFYVVRPAERAVVLLFGQVVARTEPGLRYRLPWPIQTQYVVDVAQVRRAEVGFRTRGGSAQPVPAEGLMLTGDENIVDVQLFIQYLVQDPVKFLFRAREPERALHASAEVALRAAVGENTINYTMTDGRVEVQDRVKGHLQDLLDLYGTGLVATEARLRQAFARENFKAIIREKRADIMEAEGEEKAREIKATADKEREIMLARAYATSQRQRGEGDAQATAVTGRAFGQDPGFYAFQRRLETYERIFADGSTTILLRPDSDLLRYLETSRPRR